MFAPDLARYLDRRNVDLVVTDQPQAVRVRVERGFEVLRGRLSKAQDAAEKSTRKAMGGILLSGVLLGGGAVALLDSESGSNLGAFLAAAGLAGLVSSAIAFLRARTDIALLERTLAATQISILDGAESSDELLAQADAALALGKQLGAARDDESSGDERNPRSSPLGDCSR